jgi:hypothetical protein
MDIHYAVNTLSRFVIAPRQSHLSAKIRVFGYLKKHPGLQITADPSATTRLAFPADHSAHTWTEFYPEAHEDIPPDMPIPLGATPSTYMYVDADHAHNQVTRTGIFTLVNGMPIRWYSKRQHTVESSGYGSELVAARLATEQIIDI